MNINHRNSKYRTNSLLLGNHSGYQWEKTFFGIHTDEGFTRPNNMGFAQAINYTKRMQRELGRDTKYPKSDLTQSFFSCIASYIPENCRCDFELFCAIGTPLDYCHGIDGFFKLGNNIVTFDLTTRTGKGHVAADLLLRPDDFETRDMWKICKKIADMLMK